MYCKSIQSYFLLYRRLGRQDTFILCVVYIIVYLLRYKNLHESVLKLNSRVENLIKKHGENGVTGKRQSIINFRKETPIKKQGIKGKRKCIINFRDENLLQKHGENEKTG